MQLSTFLRTVLKLDAVGCLVMAAIALPAAGALHGALGVDPSILRGAAAALIPIGLFIGWLGTRRGAAVVLVWLVIAGNLGWSAASLAAAEGLPGITPLGQTVIALQAIAVLAISAAEWIGLRGSLAANRAAA